LLDHRLDPKQWEIIAGPAQSLRKWVQVSVALDNLNRLTAAAQPGELREARRAFVENFPDVPASKQLKKLLEKEAAAGK